MASLRGHESIQRRHDPSNHGLERRHEARHVECIPQALGVGADGSTLFIRNCGDAVCTAPRLWGVLWYREMFTRV